MTEESQESCENCYGVGHIVTMKSSRWGQPIDTSPPPVCPVCKGTKVRPKAGLGR